MKKSFSKNCALALASLALCLSSTVALGDKWNLASSYPDADFHTRNIHQFVEDVAQATDELNITVHSGGSLIAQDRVKRAVQTGQVEAGELIIALLGNEDSLFSVDSIPFLATNYDDAAKLWKASRPEIESILAEDGLKLLFAVPWPPQGLYVSKPIEELADLEGLKLRVYNSAIARFAEMTGMESVQVQVPELPQAFATGMVDASFSSSSTGVSTKAWEYANYFYDVQAWLPKNMVIVNQQAFDSLSEDVQEAVLGAAETAETRGWEMSQEESLENIETLTENGLEVVQPSDQLMTQLRGVADTMVDEWLEKTGDAGKQVLDEYYGE